MTPTITPRAWRRSTRSGDNQGNCVEAGAWRKSTKSGEQGGNCLEAGTCTCHGIAIRDSKLPTTGDYPTLSISSAEWTALLTDIKTQALKSPSATVLPPS